MKAFIITAEQGSRDTYRVWNHAVVLLSDKTAERERDRLNAASKARALEKAHAERERVLRITGRPHPISAEELARGYASQFPHYEVEEHVPQLVEPSEV